MNELEIKDISPGMRKLTLVASVSVILLAGLELIGWICGWQRFAVSLLRYIPMAPSTAVCFIILTLDGLFAPRVDSGQGRFVSSMSVILLVMVYCGLGLLEYLGYTPFHIEDSLFPDTGFLNGVPLARMSPLTAVLFILCGVAMLLGCIRSTSHEEWNFLGNLSGLLGCAVAFAGFTILLGYAYGTPFLYGRGIVPVAATTAAAFLFLGFAVVTQLKPDDIPLRYVLGPRIQPRLVRAFAPFVFLAVLFQGAVGRFIPLFVDVGNALFLALCAAAIAILAVIATSKIAAVAGNDIDQAERALRLSEERYRRLLEHAPLMYVITRNELGVPYISDCNELFLAAVGYSREEVMGRPLGDFYSPESRAALLAGGGYARALAGEFCIGERELIKRNGDLIPTLLYTTVEAAPSGQVTGTHAMFVDIAERKQAEKALRESELRFRSVFENDHVVMLIIDPETGGIEDASPGACSFYGYNREELKRKKISEINVLSSEEVFGRLQMAKAQQRRYFDFRHRLATGEVRDVEVCTGPIVNGGKTYLFSVINDVTVRKQAEEALKESEKRYRMLFEAASDAIYILDAEGAERGRIISANREAAEMHGYTIPELLTMNIADLDTLEAAGRISDRMERLLRGETVREVATHRKKNGTVFPIEINARLIEFGERKYVLAMDRDVTEQEKAQTALRESERRLRLINDSSPVGITIDQDGKYVYVNPSFVRMFGYETPEQIVGLPVEALFAPESRGLIHRRQADRSAGKVVPLHYEAIGITRDGKRFDLEAWGTEIEYLGRRSSLAFAMDVSEAKSLRSQLLQAQKMEAIGTLAGGIAHDFNNLLTVILGYSELIASEKDEGDKEYEDLTKVIHAARTAGDMVQQILAFSRKTETKLRPINLNKQVDQLRKMLSRLIPKTIEVEMNLDSGLPTVNADPAQIEQVLMNLAVNARDAMPDGGNLLIETRTVFLDEEYCRFHLDALPGRHALLVVTDTGIGIHGTMMDRIFEPFYTTKKPGQGTGLGLAMVYGIVKSHGGHITCESELGSGTAFRIYLPAHEVEGDTEASVSREFSVMGTGTILLADDELFVRQLGRRILEKAGYTVISATNGQEAVEVYKENGSRISLVILDLIMPVMDGSQCLEEILRLDPRATVLIASGYTPDGTVRERLVGRVKGFVAKPYELKQLLKAVRDALKEK